MGAWGLPRVPAQAADVPAAFDGSKFQLKAPEPAPKSGGVLRYGITSRQPHFDVHQSATVNNIGTQGCMFDNLIRHDPRDGGQTIIPDPSDYFNAWYRHGGPQNYSLWQNKAFDALADEIDRTVDPVRRRVLVHQCEAIMEQDPPMLPVAWEKTNDVWYDYVKGHDPYDQFGTFDLVRLDTVWLDR
jgi:hypothetical protein